MRKFGAYWNRAVFFVIIPAAFILAASGVWAGGEAEESSDYGKYAAAAGLVLPPEQVNIESIVASVDYYYPYPEKPAGAQLFAGNRQIPATGQTELLHIGIQGQAVPFEELIPMDLVLVVDTGGTMAGEDKLSWVKESLLALVGRVRKVDRVAIIAAGEKPALLFPLQPVGAAGGGTDVSSIISGLEAGSDSDSRTPADLGAALDFAYHVPDAESAGGTSREHTRRIILLSDGRSLTEEAVKRSVEWADEKGVAVTTVGYGVDYNLEMMRELGLESGGTARFITGKEDIQEHFSDELDRMVYPVAQDVRLELTLASGLRLEKSWGFDHEIAPGSLRFTIDTLHNRDYETILAEVRIPSANYTGRRLIASLSGTYRDRGGREISLEKEELHVTFIDDSPGVVGYSDPVVLRSGSVLHYAQTLEEIGRAYHGSETKNREFLQGLIDTAQETRNQLENARMRLQDTVFDDFISLLDNYIATLGKDAGLSEREIETVRNSTEIVPGESEKGVTGQIEPLGQEIAAVLAGVEGPKLLTVEGFYFRQSSENDLSMLLEQTTSLTLLSAGGIQIVPPEQAGYSLRGTIVEMGKTVIVFAELSVRETERVLSVSQVILNKSDELIAMLGTAPPPPAAAADTAGEETHPNLEVLDLNPVFPSRLPLYEENPFGLVKIENPFNQELTDVRVTFFASRVMDRPVLANSSEKIGAGKDATAFLLALFSPDILELRDRLRVSGDIELRYKLGDEPRRKTIYTTLVVENRNALIWNDDRSAASFVTPRDPEILRTARNIVNAAAAVDTGEVDQSIARALAVYEAVRTYGITYVVDPETPFDKVSRQAGLIDFIQFPKETLQYRSGDCDDLSVLHAALLEAVGIETAFVTIPGHIYLAFAVEPPPAAVFRMFPDRESFILHESKVWVPLELTNRNGNFTEAWKEGAENWRRFWEEGTAELIPIRSAWQTFPPVSAPVRDRPLGFPGDAEVREVFERQFTLLADRELRKHEEAFRAATDRAGGSGRAAGKATKTELARLENSLGVTYARFGRYGKAEGAFRRAIEGAEIPEARFNLGRLKLLTGEYADAIGIYEGMLEDSPESTRVLKALVAAYRLAGNEREAEAYGDRLAALDPGAAGDAVAAGDAAAEPGGEETESAQTGRASRMDTGSLGIEWEETGGTE